MQNASYVARRGQLQTYFDRTAADAWAKLHDPGISNRDFGALVFGLWTPGQEDLTAPYLDRYLEEAFAGYGVEVLRVPSPDDASASGAPSTSPARGAREPPPGPIGPFPLVVVIDALRVRSTSATAPRSAPGRVRRRRPTARSARARRSTRRA